MDQFATNRAYVKAGRLEAGKLMIYRDAVRRYIHTAETAIADKTGDSKKTIYDRSGTMDN